MRATSLRRLVSLVMAASALVAAGCGSGGAGSGGSAAPGGVKIGEGKPGGSVRLLWGSDVDHLDPGQTFGQSGYTVLYATNRPLYSFAPDDGPTPTPDVADGPPEISQDAKTITVHLRTGIRYAPPVDREVKAQDVKYAIERSFTTSVEGPYAGSYFAEIEGAPAKPVRISALKPFPGLQTPDAHTLVIRLTKPVAQRVAAALVMPITVPVPQEYAKRFDAQTPTEYDRYAAFTGPYMVRNDPRTGEAVGHRPGERIQLVRNPNWKRDTDYRPAFLDSIDIEEGNAGPVVAAKRTLGGQGLLCCDLAQPPPTILRQALARHPDQLGRTPAGGTRWVAMNTTVKPFDNLDVRKAVIAGFDRTALRRTRGGEAVGPIAESFLPPGLPGHAESGGLEGFPELDWMRNPDGDAALSRRYFDAAAREGVPVKDGRYAGRRKLLMVASTSAADLKTAQVAASQFERLGFKVDLRKVREAKSCGVPKATVAICPSAGRFRDFFDAQSLLQPTFDGNAILEAHNSNWSQLDDAAIDDALAAASRLEGADRNQAFADVNRMIVAQAPAIPYLWEDDFDLESRDVRSVMSPYTGAWDLSFTSLK